MVHHNWNTYISAGQNLAQHPFSMAWHFPACGTCAQVRASIPRLSFPTYPRTWKLSTSSTTGTTERERISRTALVTGRIFPLRLLSLAYPFIRPSAHLHSHRINRAHSLTFPGSLLPASHFDFAW
jgi:hypothetical protein